MNLYLLSLPTYGRYVEEYIDGIYEKSWCEIGQRLGNDQRGTLVAKRKQQYDVYWYMSDAGFEMGFSKVAFDILFSRASSSIEVTELNVTHRAQGNQSPETVYHVDWKEKRISIDGAKLERIKDLEIPVNGDMSFVEMPSAFPFGIGMLETFHNWYVVSQEICDQLIEQKIQQIAIVHIDRIPMDSGDINVKYKNDINRLIEQGFSRSEAVAYRESRNKSTSPRIATKKWRDGRYID